MHVLNLLAALSTLCAAANPSASAYRQPNKSYLDYVHLHSLSANRTATPLDVSVAFAQFQAPELPEWPMGGTVQARFEFLRDHRWLDDNVHGGFPRRLAWLFPDDGCYVRAALMLGMSDRQHWPAPKKIFVFADLVLKTPYAPSGLDAVTWWYHVAAAVQSGGQVYVLDPSVDIAHPLRIADWLKRITSVPAEARVAVCSQGAYTPDDPCASDPKVDVGQAQNDEVEFLTYEWARLEQLRREPLQDLGPYPPWTRSPKTGSDHSM